MSDARQSILVWSIYVYVLGAVLLLIPNVLLGLFGIADTDEVWIRVVGMTVMIFGVLYTGALRGDSEEVYAASVYGRGFATVVLVVLAFTTGPWQLVLFAAVDAAGAGWTWMGLRDRRPTATAAVT